MAKQARKGFVLDGSMTLAWLFPDERATYPVAVLDSLQSTVAHVPAHWHLEVVNGLIMGERRKRSTSANTTTWLGLLQSLPIRIDRQTQTKAWVETVDLARKFNLTSYDAAYLELAIRRRLPLASLDAPLNAAAVTSGVTIYAP